MTALPICELRPKRVDETGVEADSGIEDVDMRGEHDVARPTFSTASAATGPGIVVRSELRGDGRRDELEMIEIGQIKYL